MPRQKPKLGTGRASSQSREPATIGALVVFMVLLWIGYVFHHASTFPGSLLGHSIGIIGGLLMLVPLAYSIVKRVKRLKNLVTRWISMRRFLVWHIYAGILGPILVIVHTGHNFDSSLGIALTAMTILVVISGYVGRYLMRSLNSELKELRRVDASLGLEITQQRTTLNSMGPVPVARSWYARLRRTLVPLPHETHADAAQHLAAEELLELVEMQSDVQFEIRSHDFFKRCFGYWLKAHIFMSLVLYVLLGLHVWATLFFGLRWLT